MSISELTGVKWLKSYEWSFIIEGMPSGVSGGVCSSVNVQLGSVQGYDFEVGGKSLWVPKGTGLQSISAPFYDTSDGRGIRWLMDWCSEITGGSDVYGRKNGVLPLSECYKTAELQIGSDCGGGDSLTFLIVPRDNLAFNGTQDSGLATFTGEFTVVGTG